VQIREYGRKGTASANRKRNQRLYRVLLVR